MWGMRGAVAGLPPALAQEAWGGEWGWAAVASLAQGRMEKACVGGVTISFGWVELVGKPPPVYKVPGFTGIVIWKTFGDDEGFISHQRWDSAPDGGLLNLFLSPSSGHLNLNHSPGSINHNGGVDTRCCSHLHLDTHI